MPWSCICGSRATDSVLCGGTQCSLLRNEMWRSLKSVFPLSRDHTVININQVWRSRGKEAANEIHSGSLIHRGEMYFRKSWQDPRTKSFFSFVSFHEQMVQIAWRGCGVSILGELQKPSRHGLRQLVLGDPASAVWLEQMTSKGTFQPQPFCDSLNK